MIYLILALFTSLLIVVSFRLFEKYEIKLADAITYNYLIASLLGFYFCDKVPSMVDIVNKPWFNISIINGTSLLVVFFIFAFTIQRVGVALTAVSSKFSVIIQIIIAFFIYHEATSLIKVIGIIICLFSFYLIFKKENLYQFDVKKITFPIILFFGVGMNDAILKFAQFNYIKNDYFLYLAVAFSASFIIGAIILLVRMFIYKQNFEWKNFFAGICLGIFNFSSTWFFLKALTKFDSAVFFPVFNLTLVGLAALLGILVFKEKLTKTNWIGIVLALIAILLISLF